MTTRLPFALTPLAGEALPDYLAAYALLLHTTVEELCEALGLSVIAPLRGQRDTATGAFSQATGLPAELVEPLLATRDKRGALGGSALAAALRSTRSRPAAASCPHCRHNPAADPAWMLPWVIHCPTHTPDPGGDPQHAAARYAQQFIDTAVRALDSPQRPGAAQALADLTAIAAHHTTPGTCSYWYTRTLHGQLDTPTLIHAHSLLTSPLAGHSGDPLAALVRLHEPGRPIAVPQSWNRASLPLRRRIARREGLRITPTDALRYATTLPFTTVNTLPPRATDPALTRAGRIPGQLWPAWAIRLTDNDNVNGTHLRAALAAALLLPASDLPLPKITDLVEHPLAPVQLTHQLRNLARTPRGTDALRILTELALALDEHHIPIDYARRRRLTETHDLIDAPTCATLLRNAEMRTGGPRRHHLMRSYLYELLTGGSIATAPPPYHIPKGQDRAVYVEFLAGIPAPLTLALTKHAHATLATHGINEPLQWQPPTTWVTATTWPGADPDHTDHRPIHQAVLNRWATAPEHWSPTAQAAKSLGISNEHLRHVLRHHPLPHAPYTLRKPGSILADHDAATPYRAAPSPDHPKRIYVIDPNWLREQYVTIGRAIRDIAEEIGCHQGVLRRHMEEHRYPLRGPGNNSYVHTGATSTPPADLPALLRAALTGNSGPQKVRRFLTITEHPSLNQAAITLGIPPNALTHQLHTLEQHCGGPLLHRRPRPQPVGPLTELGEQLCQQARQHLTPLPHPIK